MIYIVGVGPGSEDYLTLKAVETVKNADIIAGSKRLLNLFDIKEGSKYVLTVNLKEELKELFDKKENYTNIVILSSGDPCFSGLLKTVLNYVDKTDIEVISGISSIQIVASKIKISWEDYDILTLHGKEENRATLLNLIKNNKKVIFLPSDVKGDIKYLLENGVNPNKKIWICESLTYPNEKIIYDSLDNILNDKNNISYFSVCVVD
jgi:cobalt-precorrin-7 (C5)-methyltransferase